MSALEKILKSTPQSIKNVGVYCLLITTLSFGSNNNAIMAEETIPKKRIEELAQEVVECYGAYAKESGKSFLESAYDKQNLVGWYKGLNLLSPDNKELMVKHFKKIILDVREHFSDASVISLDKEAPLTPLEKRAKDELLKGSKIYIETVRIRGGSTAYFVAKPTQPTPSCMVCHKSPPNGALAFILPKEYKKLDLKPNSSGGY